MRKPHAILVGILLTLATSVNAQVDPDAIRRLTGRSLSSIRADYGSPDEVRTRNFDGARAEVWIYNRLGRAFVFQRGRVVHVDALGALPGPTPGAEYAPSAPVSIVTPAEYEAARRQADAAARRDMAALLAPADLAVDRLRHGQAPAEAFAAAEALRGRLQAFRDTHRAQSRDATVEHLERAAIAINVAASAWSRQAAIEHYLPQAQALAASARGAEAASRTKNLDATKEEHGAAVRFRLEHTQRAEQAVKDAAATLNVKP